MRFKKAITKKILTTAEMELCLVYPKKGVFPFTRYMVLPRARWGMPKINHECDMLALSKNNVLSEVEIKISKSDLIADKRKRHMHKSDVISRLFYAVPEHLVEFALTFIPEYAGLIKCHNGYSTILKRPKYKKSDKLNEADIKHMYELLQMRYWSEKTREHNRIQKKTKKLNMN